MAKTSLEDTEDIFKDWEKEYLNKEEDNSEKKKNPKPRKSKILKYKDEAGNLSEPQDMSDLNKNNLLMERTIEMQEKQIQLNERQLEIQEQELKRKRFKDNWVVFISIVSIGFILWLIWYVITNNVVNNMVWAFRKC